MTFFVGIDFVDSYAHMAALVELDGSSRFLRQFKVYANLVSRCANGSSGWIYVKIPRNIFDFPYIFKNLKLHARSKNFLFLRHLTCVSFLLLVSRCAYGSSGWIYVVEYTYVTSQCICIDFVDSCYLICLLQIHMMQKYIQSNSKNFKKIL